jgi:predicted transcriptional regulator
VTGATRPAVDHRSRFLRFFKVGDMEAVERGFSSLDAGRFVEHDEVGKRIEQRFR